MQAVDLHGPGPARARAALSRLLAVLWFALAAASPAQEPEAPAPEAAASPDRETAAPGTPAPLDRAATRERRERVAARIAALRTASPADPEELARLEREERLLSLTLDEITRRDEIQAQLEASRQALELPPREELGHEPPYALGEYDALHAELQTSASLLESLKQAANGAAASLEQARAALEKAEKQRRAAREAAGSADAAAPANQRVETAETERALRRVQVDNARAALEARELRIARIEAVLQWLDGRVVPTSEEFAASIARLDARAAELSHERELAELQLEAARQRWERRASRAPADEDEDASLRAELAARRAELAAVQKQVALLGQQLERLERARELERRRFAVFGADKPPRAQIAEWNKEGRAAREALLRELQLDGAERAALTDEIAALAAAPAGDWKERQVQALRETLAAYDANLASLRDGLAREELLLDAFKGPLGSFDLTGRALQLRALLADAWGFEITSSEDRSVTVGKLLTGALVFLVGILVARVFARWFGPRVFRRAGVEEGAAHAYESLWYYVLLATAFLTALRIVDIPLTAFAVLGGALAIGVGFGSQNVVNNFISGLILLAERPIKRGDVVELEGVYGNVESIGLRSTRVRTGDNVHLIIPNSAFLENRVVNWTHNDRQVRIRVSVGVVYGSPTREVQALIRKVLDESPSVLKQPEPSVLFTDFGDNSLNFDARFWVVIRSITGRMRIESEIRFGIDDAFRAAGIVIAFPQRDVHLDASAPIPVQLVDGEAGRRRPGDA